VPGPQIPLYMLGARMERCYPVVNLQPKQGLGVGLFSYAGTLGWGFTADPDFRVVTAIRPKGTGGKFTLPNQ